MTDEQFDRLLAVLDRIGEKLEVIATAAVAPPVIVESRELTSEEAAQRAANIADAPSHRARRVRPDPLQAVAPSRDRRP